MIIDIIILIILALGVFLGYKKGLINVIFGFIGIFIAIGLSLITYKIVVKNIIPYTGLDKLVYNVVEQKYQNAEKEIESSIEIPEILKKYFSANVIINQTSSNNIEKVTNFLVNTITILILTIIYYIILFIIKIILNNVAKLPILNGANKIGGAILGGVKNVIIVLILLTLLSFYLSVGKMTFLSNQVEQSIITKFIYNNNVLTKLFINTQSTNEKNI